MSLYKDLNNIHIDLSSYTEETPTPIMQKEWEKRVFKKLTKKKNGLPRKKIGIIAIAVLTMGITTSSLANTSFMTHIIERFMNQVEPPNYETYKTSIGETAENEYGKLTLNEVLLDEGRLLISSSFEPVDSVPFNYKTHLIPKVLVNGEDLTHIRGGQSVEVTDSLYTIYGNIELNNMPKTESLQIEISYDTFNHTKTIDNPWIFNIDVSTNQLTKDTTTIPLNKTITLMNAQQVTIEKVISTPMSTFVQYDLTTADEAIFFKIISTNGEEWTPYESFHSDDHDSDISHSRYESIPIKDGIYSLVPYKKNEGEIGPAIPIK